MSERESVGEWERHTQTKKKYKRDFRRKEKEKTHERVCVRERGSKDILI